MPNVQQFLRRFGELDSGADDRATTVEKLLSCAADLSYPRVDCIAARDLLAISGEDIKASFSIYRASINAMLDGTPDARSARSSPFDDDALITSDGDWPVDKILNLALARRIVPTKSVALVTTIRNEGLGLLEWVAYHLAIGIEKIFVYFNDNDDGSDLLIKALDGGGYITSIENFKSGRVSIQAKGIEHSLHLLPELRHYQWVLYLDADEFFISRLGPDYDLPSILAPVEANNASEPIDAVMFNWKWFGSENALSRTPGLLLDRFIYSKPNPHTKCLVRLRNILSMRHLHFPIMLNPERIVHSDLRRPLDMAHETGRCGPIYAIGQINHYWNKSFEEFLIKQSRGRAQSSRAEQRLDFRSFFDWGTNQARGEFDPPPESAMLKTRLMLAKLLQSEDIRAASLEIEVSFMLTMEKFRSTHDVVGIHRARGVPVASAVPI